jgi:hypothetical protein
MHVIRDKMMMEGQTILGKLESTSDSSPIFTSNMVVVVVVVMFDSSCILSWNGSPLSSSPPSSSSSLTAVDNSIASPGVYIRESERGGGVLLVDSEQTSI